MNKLPIGIQDFGELRRGGYVYVDKTELIHRMVTMGKPYFLSRPRRFGKSLLVSTLKALFEGKRELFQGLWIEDQWNWGQTNPVLHFSFEAMNYHQIGLEKALQGELQAKAEKFNVDLKGKDYKSRFASLIRQVALQNGQVVLLIDEYDKPITDYLNESDISRAKANRDVLREFYGILKSADEHLRLIFITGISKFSKVSIFSHLNNLLDITMDGTYANITGYTQQELESYFEQELDVVGQKLGVTKPMLIEHLRVWYNGYSWDGNHFLYNPFGILNFLQFKRFQNFWMATGSPRMLIHQMREQELFEVEGIKVNSVTFEEYDIEHISLIPLLFQSGYLTVKEVDAWTGYFKLDYPNKEVRESMYTFLLRELSSGKIHGHTGRTVHDLQEAFSVGNLQQIQEILNGVLADLPYETFDRTSEGLFHGLIHILFNYLGLYCDSEVHSSRGRADAVVQTLGAIYIFEFKINETATDALRQIVEKGYADRYRSVGKQIVGIGVNFDGPGRKIQGWEVATL